MRQPLHTKIFAAILVALGISLICPRSVMASDFSGVGAFLFLGIPTLVIFVGYSIFVLVAIFIKRYRSRKVVYRSLIYSMIMTVLVIFLLLTIGFSPADYLTELILPLSGSLRPEYFQDWLFFISGPFFLLCFIWLAPIVQYLIIGRR